MLAATVMPHVAYLYATLTSDMFGRVEPGPDRRRMIGATRTDFVFAMIPAGCVNVAGGLSFGLPFVLVPLLRLTSDRGLMGADANGRAIRAVGWLITIAIVALNAILIAGVVADL